MTWQPESVQSEQFTGLCADLESPGLENLIQSKSGLTGVVLSVQANYYQVQLDAVAPEGGSANGAAWSQPGLMLLCTRRSRLKKIGQRVMVGDRVQVEEPDWAGERGAIAAVFPRSSQLDRPSIANVNQILLLFSLIDPPLDPYQLSRFLVQAETTGLKVCLALNKMDLTTIAEQRQWQTRLAQWGYQPNFLSVVTGQGVETLQARLANQITVVAGPSGVGKSSLLNALIPQAALRVGRVSDKIGRGRHTTRHVQLFQLPKQGLLADTPGFNHPDLTCAASELARYFPEIRQRLAGQACQFADCLHREEPNCVVRGNWERYEHYLKFLDEAIVYQTQLERQSTPDESLKAKDGRDGQREYEPRLESRQYRRTSRRRQQQELQKLYQDLDL